MRQLYRRTFEQIRMPEERSQALRTALVSRCSDKEMEDKSMISQKTLRRPAVLAIALLTLLALTATAFAAGGYVVYRISAGENELPEGSVNEWIDFEADDVLPYDNYTEENGEVTVIFDPEDWEK